MRKPRRLILSKTTLRILSTTEASAVAGGKGLFSFPANTCATKLPALCPTNGHTCGEICTAGCPIQG